MHQRLLENLPSVPGSFLSSTTKWGYCVASCHGMEDWQGSAYLGTNCFYKQVDWDEFEIGSCTKGHPQLIALNSCQTWQYPRLRHMCQLFVYILSCNLCWQNLQHAGRAWCQPLPENMGLAGQVHLYQSSEDFLATCSEDCFISNGLVCYLLR